MGMAKVNPLVNGLKGFDAAGNSIDLEPGIHRWMEYEQAMAAEAKGKVQLLAGLDAASVKIVEPESEEKPKRTRRKKTYSRKDIVAEQSVEQPAEE